MRAVNANPINTLMRPRQLNMCRDDDRQYNMRVREVAGKQAGKQRESKKRSPGHQTEGDANANIFVFRGCIGGAFSTRIDREGEESAETIFALKSSMPGGVGGDADEAGEVDAELEGEGVGGVIGVVSYEGGATICSGCIGLGLGGED